MTFVIPTLDHAVINAQHRMDEAQARFARLGFTLTPRGYHTLGSMNHLAIFGTDYLELIGAREGDPERTDILGWPCGLNALVFASDDSARTFTMLKAAGVPIREPVEFSRPVELADGTKRDAVFRTVRLPHESVAAGRLYFCQHFTRDLVWRDEWRVHPNAVLGVDSALIAARDPETMGALFRAMFGPDAVRTIPGGLRLYAGLSKVDVLTFDALERIYGDALPDAEGRETFMAGLVFRVRLLAATMMALRDGKIDAKLGQGRIVVAAREAFGAMLVFAE